MEEIPNRFGSRTKSDMRILFIITVRGHGRGGHFHSLNHISQALGEDVEVGICTYGIGKSIVLEDNPYFKKHIFYNGKNFLKYKKEVQYLLSDYKPEVLHFFDLAAYDTFGLFFNLNKYQVFLNKCGGPNYNEFPLIKNLILFSEENLKWFKENNKFNKANIIVIPNRVNPKLLDINFEKKLMKKESFCFVRIARIGLAYKKSIEDSIRLVERLSQEGLNIHLYLIGTIQEKDVSDEIQLKIKNLPITILNQDEYTIKASDMLYLADAVIATGRGIMEATALGKPILTTAKNSEFPILVSGNNFMSFFDTNFSGRSIASESCLKINYSEIKKLINDKEFFDNLSNFSKLVFEQNFSTKVGTIKYLNFYKTSKDEKKFKLKVFADLKSKLKTWYSFVKQ
ncbi:hypothetical protein [Flavobacterium sp.]|uniref:hypothetical protein n=1 Tax=Flavobacterium sp. TaxID=239 RepID=UPI0033424305